MHPIIATHMSMGTVKRLSVDRGGSDEVTNRGVNDEVLF